LIDLVTQYANAIRARPLIKLLPDGPRQLASQYEQMVLEDIQAQTGNPNLTEKDILHSASLITPGLTQKVLPVIQEFVIPAIKKQWPTATWISVLSAIISYLVPLLAQK